MLHVIPRAVFLHVEDNVNDARVFRQAVESVTSNIRVRRVASAETALELIGGAGGEGGPPFDCVVTSLSLPGMGGGDLARRLRQRYDSATLPLIGMTRDTPVGNDDRGWFDAIYQKCETPRGLRAAAQAAVDLWFSQARRFHC
ncbi:response regulator [Stappia sp. MMSF_3263]|uniref:response regulator n=1 Tax=Stappia sp. MMSF_3263 TaxID=3046693 RepID=UPI00273DDF24|nr:response regulator [Stappia sp. MMSF_3263]